MKIFNHTVMSSRGGKTGPRVGRRYDASGKIFFTDGHIRIYATVSREGDFGKIMRVLFVEDENEYFLIADDRGNKIQNINRANKSKNDKLMFRAICDEFPHKGGEQWFLGTFADETKTRIKLTFDK